jgi:hypothetical protein
MNIKEDKIKWTALSIEDKARLAKERLLDPEVSIIEFSRKHNLETTALRKLEAKLNFNEETAVGELMWRVMAKDNQLIEMASDLNLRFINQEADKKIISWKSLETIDKLVNTGMKRAAIIAAVNDKESGEGKWIDVVISF